MFVGHMEKYGSGLRSARLIVRTNCSGAAYCPICLAVCRYALRRHKTITPVAFICVSVCEGLFRRGSPGDKLARTHRRPTPETTVE